MFLGPQELLGVYNFGGLVLVKSNWRGTYMRKVISLIGLLVMVFTIAGITTAADEKTMT